MSSSAPHLLGVRRTTVVDERSIAAVAARAHIVSRPAPANLAVGKSC